MTNIFFLKINKTFQNHQIATDYFSADTDTSPMDRDMPTVLDTYWLVQVTAISHLLVDKAKLSQPVILIYFL
jgi:hypothetical protein